MLIFECTGYLHRVRDGKLHALVHVLWFLASFLEVMGGPD